MSLAVSSVPPTPDAPLADRIDRFLADLQRLAVAGTEQRALEAPLLAGAIELTSADWAGVWRVSDSGEWRLALQERSIATRLSDPQGLAQSGLRVLADDQLLGQAPGQPTADDSRVIVARDAEQLAITLVFATAPPEAARAGLGEFAQQLLEILNLRERASASNESRGPSFFRFAATTHAAESWREALDAIAADGGAYAGCGRMAITLRRGSRERLVAVSGLDRFERRAETARCLEMLAKAVARGGEPLRWFDGAGQQPPQIDDPLQRYLEETGARAVTVLPLIRSTSHRHPPLGTLFFEYFGEDAPQASAEREQRVADHAAVVIDRVERVRRSPPLAVFDWLARRGGAGVRRLLSGVSLAAIAVTAAILGLMAEVPLRIEAPGELVPAMRKTVFAQVEGVVLQVLVKRGDEVQQGAPLVRLESTTLRLEQERLAGEQEVAQQELAAVRLETLSLSSGFDEAGKMRQLASREAMLVERIENLSEQRELLDEELARLVVTAPIDGRVQSWGVEQELIARPVRRGDALLELADLTSGWELRLWAPDGVAGHVLAAIDRADESLPIDFVLASDPEQTRSATIERVGLSTQIDPVRGGVALPLRASVLPDEPSAQGDPADNGVALRPGAGVAARIHCGDYPRGYVWFHEFYEAVRRRWF